MIKNGALKISDFGLSKLLLAVNAKNNEGTPKYWSPEIFEASKFDFPSDVW